MDGRKRVENTMHAISVYASLIVPLLGNCFSRGGGGGGTQVHRGAASALHISRKKGSSLRPPHGRNFVKEGYFFVPRHEIWG